MAMIPRTTIELQARLPAATRLRSIETSHYRLHDSIMAVSRQLPMPTITRITSLIQAQATLQHCWTRLSNFMQDYPSSASTASSSDSCSPIDERQRLQAWLERWELAFTEYLTNAMATMNGDDITQSRILKTNHLACTVLTADGELSHTALEAEFSAIIELSGAVLRTRYAPEARYSPANPTSLDVIDPLMIVISRCNMDAFRTRAAELLRLGRP